jgi:hypothetical protein
MYGGGFSEMVLYSRVNYLSSVSASCFAGQRDHTRLLAARLAIVES